MDVENIKMNISWRKEILKNTLLLHIGTPKTGTTALQKFLSENSEELKKQGWDFPDMLKEWQIQYGERAYKSTQRNGLLLRWSIIKKYSDDNYYIATNYMGRKDGVLFKEKVVDMPEYKIEFTDREKEIIKIFANVVADLRSYIKELKNEDMEQI